MILDTQHTDPTRASYRPLRVARPEHGRRRRRRFRTAEVRAKQVAAWERHYAPGGPGWLQCLQGVVDRFLLPTKFVPSGSLWPAPEPRSLDALAFAAAWAEWTPDEARRAMQSMRMEVPDGDAGRSRWGSTGEEGGSEEGGDPPDGGPLGCGGGEGGGTEHDG